MKIYQIDAFAKNVFEGNPAAVCPLEKWLPDETLQAIAKENNLSETVYFTEKDGRYHIRWFTPKAEVELCGHATLAAAWVIFHELLFVGEEILFDSLSGELRVRREGDLLVMNFPQTTFEEIPIPEKLEDVIGLKVNLAFSGGGDCFLVVDSENGVQNFNPDLSALAKFDFRGICLTARSEEVDFVSRFFAPRFGIDEDPVTGSAHTVLAPYWSKVLAKDYLIAKQVSKRSGVVHCELIGERIELKGSAVKFLEGEFSL
ncbi:MAG: PhzF family phenazine biosynthesis protein [Lentisphaeraceae bacterium]|nr:PhzF family phenazine biosynthesis protein [Lentisphaeraceae bacterium]